MALNTRPRRAKRLLALDKGLSVSLARRLRRFFRAQAARVVARYRAEFAAKAIDDGGPDDDESPVTQPPAPEELLPDSERRELWLALAPFILQAILSAFDSAGVLVGLEAVVGTDPRVQRLLADAQLNVAGMHATTLDAIRTTLAEGFKRGYTVTQLALGVPADGFRGLADVVSETYANRAQAIAVTEIATARQRASFQRYQEAGIGMVYVVDGPSCGWTTHNDPDSANGSTRTLIEAEQYPIAHPRCHRVCLPA